MAQAGSKGDSQMRNSRTWVLQADLLDEHLGQRKAKNINFPGLDSSPKCMAEFCLKYCLDFVKLNFPNSISHNFWLDLIHSGEYSVWQAYAPGKHFSLTPDCSHFCSQTDDCTIKLIVEATLLWIDLTIVKQYYDYETGKNVSLFQSVDLLF